jgi:hypothetical protein
MGDSKRLPVAGSGLLDTIHKADRPLYGLNDILHCELGRRLLRDGYGDQKKIDPGEWERL